MPRTADLARLVADTLPRFAGRASERTYVLHIAHNRASIFCLLQLFAHLHGCGSEGVLGRRA